MYPSCGDDAFLTAASTVNTLAKDSEWTVRPFAIGRRAGTDFRTVEEIATVDLDGAPS